MNTSSKASIVALIALSTSISRVLSVPATGSQGSAHDAHALHRMAPLPRELVERPLPLRAGIGTAHDIACAGSTQAQAFYDQGLAYLHSYVWIEAARSFHQSLRLDGKCALAHVGLSYAYIELGASEDAHAALDRARALTGAATDHERRHIAVRVAQMAAEDDRGNAAELEAYRRALDEALTAFPTDEELWLQRGIAESADPADRGQGSRASSRQYYERARAIAPTHAAAHHCLTHAFENSRNIEAALVAGEAYAKMAPEVPHARHMFGHELRRAGRIGEAIGEFEAADRLEAAYLVAERVPVERNWHYAHNLDLLGTSYQYIGQMKKAEERLKKSFAIPSDSLEQVLNKREWPVFLLARGRASDALMAAGTLAAHPSPLVSAIGHIEAGEAKLALKQFQAAADEGNAALRLMRSASQPPDLLAMALKQLQGEYFLRTGEREKGRTALRQVVSDVRAVPGPDLWVQALFTLEAIARTAREVDDWEFADWTATQMVEHDPNYAGTHAARALVASHRGDHSTMRAEVARARALWSKADSDVRNMDWLPKE